VNAAPKVNVGRRANAGPRVNAAPAESVFVRPNNGNIIMAAQQCQGLTEKNVVVIPSKTVPQGITAMMNVDPEAEVASITEAMTEALSTVTTSQITYAARDSDFDGFEIHQGDYLALKEGKLFGTDTQLDALLEKLAELAGAREKCDAPECNPFGCKKARDAHEL